MRGNGLESFCQARDHIRSSSKTWKKIAGLAALAGGCLCRMAIVNSAVYGTRAFSRRAEYLIDGPELRGPWAFGPDHVLFLERCENGVKRPERDG